MLTATAGRNLPPGRPDLKQAAPTTTTGDEIDAEHVQITPIRGPKPGTDQARKSQPQSRVRRDGGEGERRRRSSVKETGPGRSGSTLGHRVVGSHRIQARKAVYFTRMLRLSRPARPRASPAATDEISYVSPSGPPHDATRLPLDEQPTGRHSLSYHTEACGIDLP